MPALPDGYTHAKRLRATDRSETFGATRGADQLKVALRSYAGDCTDASSSRAGAELDALRAAAGPGVVPVLDLDRTSSRPVLVLEHVEGITLDVFARCPVEARPFLVVARQLAVALERVHAAKLVHRDITPSHIVVDPESLETWIVDFGMAASLGAIDRSSFVSESELTAKLAYMAPEQSGRMDRGIDFRSDLYALGTTLYHLLTGRPPFEFDDPLRLIHAHMAVEPVSAAELRPDLPAVLSRIVMRLLRKDPEDRYQSARALRLDLEECEAQLEDGGRIDRGLVLGRGDASSRPLFGTRIYGREAEIAELRAGLERVTSGACERWMLSGPAGVGKSALVEALRERVAESGGHLAQGKFDLYRSDLPYHGWIAAIESLVHQILTAEGRLDVWRERLLDGLGGITGVLLDLVPDLRFIVGDVPPPPPLRPRETQQRLALAFERMLRAWASDDHPLVLFLDDLQWADGGSRALLESLLESRELGSILWIGTYRDTEVGPAHPLTGLMSRLEARGVAFRRLAVRPLSMDSSTQMLADALKRLPADARPLAERIARKTGNHPLFIRQFVEHMRSRQLLQHDPREGWIWDERRIAEADIPDDAVSLMTARIDRLDASTCEVLEFASCIGHEFDAHTLAELAQCDRAGLESALFVLCEEGLITPCRAGFRFLHDRIREAAQRRCSEQERAELHQRVARHLLERCSETELAARCFEIADHLDRALHLLSQDDRRRAIEINHRAGARALGAGAVATAARYLEIARRLLGPDGWDERPDLAFDLYLASAEAAYQTDDFEGGIELVAQMEARPLTRFQLAQVLSKKITISHALSGNISTSLALVLACLRRLGIRWPARPSRARVWLDIVRTDWALRGLIAGRGLRPIDAAGLERAAASLIFAEAGGIISASTMHLLLLNVAWTLRSFRRNGYVQPSLALTTYACCRGSFAGQFWTSARYIDTARRWLGELPNAVFGADRAELMLQAYALPWLQPRHSVLEPLRKAIEGVRETGDTTFTVIGEYCHVHLTALIGTPLGPALAAFARQDPRVALIDPFTPQIYALLARERWSDREVDEECARLDAALREALPAAIPVPNTIWLGACCILRRFEQAHLHAEAMRPRVFESMAIYSHLPDYCLYAGLAAAALVAEGRVGCRRVLRFCRRRLRRWAHTGPDFVHMAELLEAEWLRLRGRTERAAVRYESAAQKAVKAGYCSHAALAHERRASLLAERGRPLEAGSALYRAAELYEEWGCPAKARALRREHASVTGVPLWFRGPPADGRGGHERSCTRAGRARRVRG